MKEYALTISLGSRIIAKKNQRADNEKNGEEGTVEKDRRRESVAGAPRSEATARFVELALSGQEGSREEWAKQADVSLTTAGKVVKELLQGGVITERKEEGALGRRTGRLRAREELPFLIATVREQGCDLAILTPSGKTRERYHCPRRRDFGIEENLAVYRSFFHRRQASLEEKETLLGTALILAENFKGNRQAEATRMEWGVPCGALETELAAEELRESLNGRVGYYLSWERDLFPSVLLFGERKETVPLPASSYESREEQLGALIKQWKAVKRLFEDTVLILSGREMLPWEEALLRTKLPRGTELWLFKDRVPAEQGALRQMKKALSQTLVTNVKKERKSL